MAIGGAGRDALQHDKRTRQTTPAACILASRQITIGRQVSAAVSPLRDLTHDSPMMTTSGSWFTWALLSAVFAAMTTIFAKIGIQGVDSDYATLIRTAIVIVVLGAFVAAAGKWSDPRALSAKTWLFLALSGLATGASWVCYFRALKVGEASKVAPVDKLSLVLVAVFAFAFLGERPSLREWSGIVMVAGGVLVLAFKR
jgi:transporter family protein